MVPGPVPEHRGRCCVPVPEPRAALGGGRVPGGAGTRCWERAGAVPVLQRPLRPTSPSPVPPGRDAGPGGRPGGSRRGEWDRYRAPGTPLRGAAPSRAPTLPWGLHRGGMGDTGGSGAWGGPGRRGVPAQGLCPGHGGDLGHWGTGDSGVPYAPSTGAAAESPLRAGCEVPASG